MLINVANIYHFVHKTQNLIITGIVIRFYWKHVYCVSNLQFARIYTNLCKQNYVEYRDVSRPIAPCSFPKMEMTGGLVLYNDKQTKP